MEKTAGTLEQAPAPLRPYRQAVWKMDGWKDFFWNPYRCILFCFDISML